MNNTAATTTFTVTEFDTTPDEGEMVVETITETVACPCCGTDIRDNFDVVDVETTGSPRTGDWIITTNVLEFTCDCGFRDFLTVETEVTDLRP